LSNNDFIVSLDIGTSKVRVIIGEIVNGTINIIGVGSSESEGLRKGAIVDIDQTVHSIRQAVSHAERMVGIQISQVYVGINGGHIALLASSGVVAVANEDREIGGEDIERVIQASRVIALQPDREIIGVVPKQYIVDGQEGINDPRGMIGTRLEIEATMITGAKTFIHNLFRVVEKSDLKVAGLILMSLASGQLILSKDEKSVGTVLVDIGAGSTTIAIFDQGHLVETSVVPIGGDFISNDICIGLQTQMDIAQKIKLKYGCASIDYSSSDITFRVTRMGSTVEKEFSQIDLAHIIEPRVQEMFQMIHDEVGRLGYAKKVSSYVLTGGTVSLSHILVIAQEELNFPVRIATPDFIGVRDPSFSNGVGIIQFVTKYMKHRSTQTLSSKKQSKGYKSQSPKPSLFERFKDFFKDFI
jgi:cell division protein FtsA